MTITSCSELLGDTRPVDQGQVEGEQVDVDHGDW